MVLIAGRPLRSVSFPSQPGVEEPYRAPRAAWITPAEEGACADVESRTGMMHTSFGAEVGTLTRFARFFADSTALLLLRRTFVLTLGTRSAAEHRWIEK